jgi:hypothetical protein
MLRDGRIEHAEGVEELALPQTFEAIAGADMGGLGGLVTIPVHHQHRCLLEGRHEKGRCMGVVMAHLNNPWRLLFNAEVPH